MKDLDTPEFTTDRSQSNFPALLARAKARVSPQTIIDVGASNGSWSLMARPHWPDAHYLLVEANPVFLPDLHTLCEKNQEFDHVSALAGASDGEAACQFNKENPFQGILLGDSPEGELVSAITIDSQVREKNLKGPYLLKFDVHGHELAILQGAQKTLLNTCAIIMEVYVWRQGVGSLRFWEMCSYLEYLGFRCADLCEPLYRPYDGRLSQVDMLFERIDAPGMDTSRWA
jgi:FkbM family methyltransferase